MNRLAIVLTVSLVASCSALRDSPNCTHPTCLEHLDLGAPKEVVLHGTWSDQEWRSVTMHGPVGRDLEVLFGLRTNSPLAFEDDHLMGWGHAFGPETWRLGPRYRLLRYLEMGMKPEQVRRQLGPPHRIARFKSEHGEAMEVWSWRRQKLSLLLTRVSTFDPLEERWILAEATTLSGYGSGFEGFRAE